MTVDISDGSRPMRTNWPPEKCVELLRLLHAVDCFPRGGLYYSFYALAAAIRYQRTWTEIMKSGETITPPLDVAFAWFVHRQDPGGYSRDLEEVGVTRGVHPPADRAFKFGPRYADRVAWAVAAADSSSAWPPPAPGSGAIPLDAYEPGLAADLAAAMGRFSRMLHSWLRPHFLDVDFLTQAQERYARFLELHADHPELTLVPTADIALVWHTHLGMSGDYAEACRKLFGGLSQPWAPDYLHLADPGKLAAAYSETTKLYQQKYGVPYDSPDTAWLADSVPYPLLTSSNPLAFALRVFDDNPDQSKQAGAIAIACKAAELPLPPAGGAVARNGGHALYAAWLAATRGSAAYSKCSSGWRRLVGKGSALTAAIQHALVSLVSISYFLELPDIDTHPYLRSIELRKGIWGVGAPAPGSTTGGGAAPAGMSFSPSDPASYLGPTEAPSLAGLAAFLSPGATPPQPAKAKGASPLWMALADKEAAAAAPPQLLTELWNVAARDGVGKMQDLYVKDEIPTISCTVCGSSEYYDAQALKVTGVQGPVGAHAAGQRRAIAAAAAAAPPPPPPSSSAPAGVADTDTGRDYAVNGVLYRAPAADGGCPSGSGGSSAAPRRKKYWSHYGRSYAPPIAFWGFGDLGGGGGCGGGGGGCGGGS